MDSGLAAARRPGMTIRGYHGTQQHQGQPAELGPVKIKEALVPPKPKEFDSA